MSFPHPACPWGPPFTHMLSFKWVCTSSLRHRQRHSMPSLSLRPYKPPVTPRPKLCVVTHIIIFMVPDAISPERHTAPIVDRHVLCKGAFSGGTRQQQEAQAPEPQTGPGSSFLSPHSSHVCTLHFLLLRLSLGSAPLDRCWPQLRLELQRRPH